MTIYTHQIKELMDIQEFSRRIDASQLPRDKDTLMIFLFYTGVRVSEALRMHDKDFYTDRNYLWCKIGKRMKRGRITKDLNLPLTSTYIDYLVDYVTMQDQPWAYSRKTAWEAAKKIDVYPHYFRFNLASQLAKVWPVQRLVDWFGWVKFETARSYIAELETREIGDSIPNILREKPRGNGASKGESI